MTSHLSLNEAVLRYCLALLLSIVTLSAEFAPHWVALASLATCYLAFTAMLQSDPLYALASRIGGIATKNVPASHRAKAPAAL